MVTELNVIVSLDWVVASALEPNSIAFCYSRFVLLVPRLLSVLVISNKVNPNCWRTSRMATSTSTSL